MANKCYNQLILTGDRAGILDLISSKKIHYKKNLTFQINANSFCIPFSSNWYPPARYFIELSKQFPKIRFKLFYFEGLLSRAGLHVIRNGESEHFKKEITLSLEQITKTKISEIFYGLQTRRSA